MIDAVLLLPKILARAGDDRELNQIAAKIAWQRAAGEGLRSHAVALRLHETTLIVAVADAAWQKQLHAMSSELVLRINRLLRRQVVKSIDFRINPRALKDRDARRTKRTRSAQPVPANIVSSAAAIEDAELRERFMRAAENCIARRDTIKSAIRNPPSTD